MIILMTSVGSKEEDGCTLNSVLKFASMIHRNKLLEKQRNIETKQALSDIHKASGSNTITSQGVGSSSHMITGSSSSLIPTREVSKLSKSVQQTQSSQSSSSVASGNRQLQSKNDNIRMFGSVLVNTNILDRNDRMLTQKKAAAKVANDSTLINKKKQLQNELDSLLSRKSAHCDHLELEQTEAYNKRVDKLVAKEAIALNKAASSATIFIKNGFYCKTCHLCMETVSNMCQQNHLKDILKTELVKRYYTCQTCSRSTFILLQNSHGHGVLNENVTLPTRRCDGCKGNNWKYGRSGAFGSGIDDRTSKDERLILSASEWSTSVDVDSMNIKVGQL